MSDDLLAPHDSAHTDPPESPPVEATCPSGVPEGARCLRGRDSMGAHYMIVIPRQWSGVLVVHAHGGPPLGEPIASRVEEDIKRWSVAVRMGHAWAGSVFRQGGFATAYRSFYDDVWKFVKNTHVRLTLPFYTRKWLLRDQCCYFAMIWDGCTRVYFK